jgi:hypothetical protein
MPASPRKCWGKNVRFTPINIVIKCAVALLWSSVAPVKRENQWLNPAKIAKTAPIDKT